METGTITSNKDILKKLYLSAFFVLCMTELMNSAAEMTDSYFIGNYVGSSGIAAMGFARPFFSFVGIISGLLGLGIQLLCSNYIGKGNIEHAQKVFSGVMIVGLAASLFIAVLGILNADRIAVLYGKESVTEELSLLTARYLRGLFIGTPFMVFIGMLSPIVQLGNGKKRIVVGVVLQLIADIIGDTLSVFVFNKDMFALGLATAVSYCFSLLPLVVYFSRKDAILKLQVAVMPYADFKEVFHSGWSKAIRRICSTLKPIILNGFSLLLGTSLALSAYSITTEIRDLLICYSTGVAGAALLIGALLYGQRDRDGLRCIADISFKMVGLSVVLGCLCFIFSRSIAGFFISDSEEVLNMAALSLRCVGIMVPFLSFNGLFISFMQVGKRFRLVNILSYLNRLILIILASAVLGYFFGTDGLWWALPVSEMLHVVICLFIVKRLNGAYPKKPEDWLCLPADFGFKPEDYIELSVKNKEDVTALLDRVGGFCKDHGIDQRRTYFTQLALEELSMNVIKHGFPQCSKKPAIHIWITYDNGDMKLRIQDNCPGFNVMKCVSELQKEGPERCIGLRIVSKISKEMNYVNMLETNNLMITI